MKKFFQILLVAVMLMNFSLASAIELGNEGYIEEEGVVYPDGQSLSEMRRIAIMDAYRYLSERVDDIYVSVNSTVRNLPKSKRCCAAQGLCRLSAKVTAPSTRLLDFTRTAARVLWQGQS